MVRKTSKFFIIFFYIASLSYTEEWRTAKYVPLMDELKTRYNTNSYLASRNRISDYAVITEDVVLFAVNLKGLILYNLKLDEKTNIPSPFDNSSVIGFWDVSVFKMTYDKKNNTVHIIVVKRKPRYNFQYWVLGLDTYSWDKIEELSFPDLVTNRTYYDSTDEKIYCVDGRTGDIIIFDFQTRKIVERIKILKDGLYSSLYAIYGSPVRILGGLQTGADDGAEDYFVYDLQTRTVEIFQNTFLRQERSFIKDYIPLGPYRFLCILSPRISMAVIIEIDLLNDTYKTVAFDGFNHLLGGLKKSEGNIMNFIVSEEIGYMFRAVQLIFCSWEYQDM